MRDSLGVLRPTMLTLFLVASLQAPVATSPKASGTYEVLFCASPCNSSNRPDALAAGVLVLDSLPILSRAGFLEKPNACFQFSRREHFDSYAVLFPAGYTEWHLFSTGDSITFDTYRSPDAGHSVTAALTDSGFVGLGHSSGAGVAAIDVPDEFVIGYRTGPPDVNRCSFVRKDRRSVWLAPLVFGATAVAGLYLLFHSAHD
jgi:hypothetical protein